MCPHQMSAEDRFDELSEEFHNVFGTNYSQDIRDSTNVDSLAVSRMATVVMLSDSWRYIYDDLYRIDYVQTEFVDVAVLDTDCDRMENALFRFEHNGAEQLVGVRGSMFIDMSDVLDMQVDTLIHNTWSPSADVGGGSPREFALVNPPREPIEMLMTVNRNIEADKIDVTFASIDKWRSNI